MHLLLPFKTIIIKKIEQLGTFMIEYEISIVLCQSFGPDLAAMITANHQMSLCSLRNMPQRFKSLFSTNRNKTAKL